MAYTLDRARTLADLVVIIHVIVHTIKDVVNIEGITTVVMTVTPVLVLAVNTLLLDVGLGLMD